MSCREFQNELIERFRALRQPLEPQPTGERPRLVELIGLRAVLIDIYGTFVISASGEGAALARRSGATLQAALLAAGLRPQPGAGACGLAALRREVLARQQRVRERDGGVPEIDLRAAWRHVLERLKADGRLDVQPGARAVERLAVEYEGRVNPCAPMPGAAASLARLRRAGLLLGVISNAQFFTPLMLSALFEGGAEGLGLQRDLCVWSYRMEAAKPDPRLFQKVLTRLKRRYGLPPCSVLMVGNDLLNDVVAAARLGMRTALFAGDARSLRWRRGDRRCAGVEPDLIVTHWRQLPELCSPPR